MSAALPAAGNVYQSGAGSVRQALVILAHALADAIDASTQAPTAYRAPSWMTPAEAAEQLNCSERQVVRWCRIGELAAERHGGRWKITAEALTAFRAQAANQGPRPARRRT